MSLEKITTNRNPGNLSNQPKVSGTKEQGGENKYHDLVKSEGAAQQNAPTVTREKKAENNTLIAGKKSSSTYTLNKNVQLDWNNSDNIFVYYDPVSGETHYVREITTA